MSYFAYLGYEDESDRIEEIRRISQEQFVRLSQGHYEVLEELQRYKQTFGTLPKDD